MYGYSKAFIVLTSGAALVVGITPSGFTPASNVDLMVVYDQVAATNGAVVDKATTANEPTLATKDQLTGTSYAVIMIDLDIPSTQVPHTFLHWMQTDLTPSTAASTMSTVSGTLQGFTLTKANNTSAIVDYTQPNPPAQNPLSHRYTEVLVDTTSLSTAGLTALTTAAQTRVGFDINTALQSAGLTNSVVAGNSFNVTNAGPVVASTSADGNANAAGNGTAAQATGGSGNGKGKNGNKTKGAGKSRTKTGGGSKATADTNGNLGSGGAKTTGNASASLPTGATPAGAAASHPTASGSSVNGNLTLSGGATGKNGTGSNSTGTVTTSGATVGYIVYPALLLVGLPGAFFWAF